MTIQPYTTTNNVGRVENDVVSDLAQKAVRAQKLEPGLYYDGLEHKLVDIRAQLREDEQQAPARKTGAYTVTDVPSFVQALAKHGLEQTELWAHDASSSIRAVINAHQGDANAGHEDYAITLQLQRTDDWKQWTATDGQLKPQLDFAEFIEDHLPNFVKPTGADMLELAQTFQATTRVDFESSQRVASGETQLTYKENQNASAGKTGRLAIPDTFEIALQPFERGETYRVQARFRYRIANGSLLLGYRLTRPKDVLRDAFDQVVAKVGADTKRQVWSTT
jgi:uncharacterized protein YfdQ (DUF2303 family)